ncbi:hypothetical protein [uncultured Stenotrophomonas sp.]|uniref:DUF7716 domain-containing protein n=1 Tax=uncultured Stenotrophomonas sp. TaxID=165438 RepID=UPI0025E62E9E|nr:hypothetical protein [uncultured Stenotrophomonas sp.]
MIELLDLRQTLDSFANCNDDDEVWARYGWVHASEGGALNASFWLPASEAEAFDDDELPTAARALGLSSFLEPATFADVLDVQKRQRPLSTLEEYAAALDYYAEYDAFLQVPGIDEALGEAAEAEQEAARALDVGPGIYASFDVVLAECPAQHVKDAARQVAALLAVSIGEALAACRDLPVCLGEQLDRKRCAGIVAAFDALGVPLQVRGYKPFPWSAVPTPTVVVGAA